MYQSSCENIALIQTLIAFLIPTVVFGGLYLLMDKKNAKGGIIDQHEKHGK